MPDRVHVPNGSVGIHDAIVDLEIRELTACARDFPLEPLAVFRVDAKRGSVNGFQTQTPVELRRCPCAR